MHWSNSSHISQGQTFLGLITGLLFLLSITTHKTHAEWLAWQADLMNIMHQMQLPTGNPSGPPTSAPPARTQTSHPNIKFNWDDVEPLDIWLPKMLSPKPVDQQL